MATQTEIDVAVRKGFALCQDTWTPFLQIGIYVRGLERESKWNAEELGEIEMRLLRLVWDHFDFFEQHFVDSAT